MLWPTLWYVHLPDIFIYLQSHINETIISHSFYFISKMHPSTLCILASKRSTTSLHMPGYRQKVAIALQHEEPMDTDGHNCEQSNLVSMLLLQSSMGKISYAAAQQLAYAAYLDGLHHPEVASLASCGTWGEHTSHMKRDIDRKFLQNNNYALPTKVATFAVNPKSNETIAVDQYIYCPHLVIKSLLKYDQFNGIFRTDLVNELWASIKPDDPKLVALLHESGLASQLHGLMFVLHCYHMHEWFVSSCGIFKAQGTWRSQYHCANHYPR